MMGLLWFLRIRLRFIVGTQGQKLDYRWIKVDRLLEKLISFERGKDCIMFNIEGFNLQSFVVGCKYTRAFSVDSVRGVIADYVLGERGVEGSPVPQDFYKRIRMGEGGVELMDKDETHSFSVTTDAMVLSERTSDVGQTLTDIDGTFERAKHLLNGAYILIKKPKAINIGIVWQFVQSSTSERETFRHPAAEFLAEKISPFTLQSQEHTSQINFRLSFRKKTQEGVMNPNINDYINIIFLMRDSKLSELWPTKTEEQENLWDQEKRINSISIDIQRIFNPRKNFAPDSLEDHRQYCESILTSRIKNMLGEIGIGEEA